jgi:hypothetical protein
VSTIPEIPFSMTVGSSVVAGATTGRPSIIASMTPRPRLV